MTLTLNGSERSFDSERLTIPELLKALDLENFPVLVEVNRQALLKSEWADQGLKDGDEVEIVKMVAGG
ncbi:MAG: sulfur carrier protein ThiS [Verrucomicrobiota bacterium]